MTQGISALMRLLMKGLKTGQSAVGGGGVSIRVWEQLNRMVSVRQILEMWCAFCID